MNPVRNNDIMDGKGGISNGMNRPLFVAFVVFMVGIVSARHISIPFITILVSAVFLLTLLLILKKRPSIIFYISSCALIFILGQAAYLNFNTLPSRHISYLLKEEPKNYYIKGAIVSSPEYTWRRWGKRRASFTFRASSYKEKDSWNKTEGLSRVNIKDSKKDYYYGDTILVLGDLKRPRRAGNPGEFDYAEYLARKKIYTVIDVKCDDGIMVLLEGGRPSFIKGPVIKARKRIEALIKRSLPVQDASILNAMLIGRRSDISGDLRERFIKTGTAHILSVSGLHVGVISSIIFFLFRLMRIPRKTSSLLVICFLIIYAILAGTRTPIIRAVIMISVFLLSYILERRFDIYSALSLAGILILALNPMDLFNAGFVLSFACVFSLCYLTPILKDLCFRRLQIKGDQNLIDKNRFVRYASGLTLGSLAVYIGIMPLTGYYFNIISPVTILANLFIVPLLWLVLFFGILFVTAGTVFAPAAALLSYPLHLSLFLFAKTIDLFASIKFGYFYVGDIPLHLVAGYYIFILLITKRKALRLNRIKIFAIALVIANIFLWEPLFAKTDNLRVSFLDTKGGDVAFLEFPDGRTILINAGKRLGPDYNEADSVVIPFIQNRGRVSVDIFISTYSDPDRTACVQTVLEKLKIGCFIEEIKDTMTVEGFDAKISLTGSSKIKLDYKNTSFLFTPGQNSFLVDGELEISAEETRENGAITITTDGLEFSIKRFLDTRKSLRGNF